jgi:hypothetical protein
MNTIIRDSVAGRICLLILLLSKYKLICSYPFAIIPLAKAIPNLDSTQIYVQFEK